MTIKRLRDLYHNLEEMYPAPHDHRIYGRGHHERVEATIMVGKETIPEANRQIVADLSCGNGEIAKRIVIPGGTLILGDFAPGYPIHGPIEETLDVKTFPLVDVFVLSETIEHLEDPLDILLRINEVSEYLLLSTPLECWDDGNAEHLWAWDREGVEGMAQTAGWAPLDFCSVDSRAWGEPYLYGIWVFG